LKFRALCLGFTLLAVAAAVESSNTSLSGSVTSPTTTTPVHVWPLPDRCAEVYPNDCNACCVSTGNQLGQWCYKYTQPGPERDECNDGVVTWFKLCVESCGKIGQQQSQ
jgi:hypothetical protein